MRKFHGRCKSVDDLRATIGIGPKGMEKMRKYFTVGKPPAPKKPQGQPLPTPVPCPLRDQVPEARLRIRSTAIGE
jgi:hypothetical protein